MNVLGVGLAALGRPAYINVGQGADFPEGRDVDVMRSRTHAVLDLAWNLGIRHVDAARSYGRAEEFLGDWLRTHPERRSDLTIGSKWGYTYIADWRVHVEQHEVKDHSLDTFSRQWPETLNALGTRPDLYLIHSVTPDSPALHDDRLLGALRDLAADGVRVGLSTSGPEQVRILSKTLRLGAGSPFTAVQSTWNLLEPAASHALKEAHDRGWHVALKETVANGRLTEANATAAGLADVASHHQVPPDAVAIAAALRQQASVTLLGPTTADQLASNMTGASVSLTEGDLRLLAKIAETPESYWQRRSSLPWN